jgi:hypothetical protein
MTKPFINRAAAKAVSLVERVFMCVSQVVVIVDGVILSAIPQVLTRYSANDPQFPVNDWSRLTGKCHQIGGASRPNGPADGEVAISICAAYHYFQWMRPRSSFNATTLARLGTSCPSV